jgi:(2Fe-2S) ferredoxin
MRTSVYCSCTRCKGGHEQIPSSTLKCAAAYKPHTLCLSAGTPRAGHDLDLYVQLADSDGNPVPTSDYGSGSVHVTCVNDTSTSWFHTFDANATRLCETSPALLGYTDGVWHFHVKVGPAALSQHVHAHSSTRQ